MARPSQERREEAPDVLDEPLRHRTALTFAPPRAHVIARVRMDATPTDVRAGTTSLPHVADRAALDTAASGWTYDAATRSAWIRTTDATASLELVR